MNLVFVAVARVLTAQLRW